MTEQFNQPEHWEATIPELTQLHETLEAAVQALGFRESDDAIAARGVVVDLIREADGYDGTIPEHQELLVAFHVAVERSSSSPEPASAIGVELTKAMMWLEVGDDKRFFRDLDIDGYEGVVIMLQRTGLNAVRNELVAAAEAYREANR